MLCDPVLCLVLLRHKLCHTTLALGLVLVLCSFNALCFLLLRHQLGLARLKLARLNRLVRLRHQPCPTRLTPALLSRASVSRLGLRHLLLLLRYRLLAFARLALARLGLSNFGTNSAIRETWPTTILQHRLGSVSRLGQLSCLPALSWLRHQFNQILSMAFEEEFDSRALNVPALCLCISDAISAVFFLALRHHWPLVLALNATAASFASVSASRSLLEESFSHGQID